MSLRTEKVNELIRHQVSQMLLREINFGGALVTIIKVETSADLRQAKVKISVIPSEKNEKVLEIIQKNIFDLQQILNKNLSMKNVPKLVFEIDKIEEKAQQIEEILTKNKG